MNTAQRSIIQEKARGTYNRNEYIRFCYTKNDNMSEIARQFHMSRQAIRKIVMRRNDDNLQGM